MNCKDIQVENINLSIKFSVIEVILLFQKITQVPKIDKRFFLKKSTKISKVYSETLTRITMVGSVSTYLS